MSEGPTTGAVQKYKIGYNKFSETDLDQQLGHAPELAHRESVKVVLQQGLPVGQGHVPGDWPQPLY